MKEIDLEPEEHSSSYELKPMSRWWLALATALLFLAAYNSGFTKWETWSSIGFGGLFVALLILCFPRAFLSRLG